MAFNKRTASDPTYHSRHARRTLARAECIAANIDIPGEMLDVGCNNGITSAFMLDRGKATHITGIELHASTVDEPLRTSPSFTMLEGNVATLELEQSYDYVVYGAVHHHILNLFGLSAAISTLQKLATHSRKHLFFETGQLGEGGRWGWHAPMRRLFRTDEEHFFYLVRSIEHLISGFEVIGDFWIHGIRRHYIRFDIRSDRQPREGAFELWPTKTDGPWVRTFGSKGQELVRAEDAASQESPTHFWIAGEPGEQLFVKKHVHLPVAADAEWSIGRQVDAEWAVRPVSRVGEEGAIAFPYLPDADKIMEMRVAPSQTRRAIVARLVEIYEDACETSVALPDGLLLSDRTDARLVDIVDLNANNLLVVNENDTDVVRVIDFEPQSTDYASRNRMHIANVLWVLGQRRMLAAILFVSGAAGVVAGLVRFQFVPFAQRVAKRQPSVVSVLVAEFRNVVGKILGQILRLFGLD